MLPRVSLLLLLSACSGSDDAATTTPGDDDDDTSTTDTSPTDTSTSDTTMDTRTTDTSTGLTEVTDFRLEGPHAVAESSATLELKGCSLRYDLYLPGGDATAPLLVLGHGFQRAPRHMADLARHVASHGVQVAAPEFCWDRLAGSDHPRNGRDAAELAESLAPGAPVVYAGQSAGGLASFFAADADPDAIAVLGLDPVDTTGEVADALGREMPRWALLGEPGACSGNAAIRPYLEDGGCRTSALVGATHCDFELPTDALCTTLCGDATGAADIVKTVLAAFVADRHGLDPTARAWVDGESWQGLLDAGVAVELQAADPAW